MEELNKLFAKVVHWENHVLRGSEGVTTILRGGNWYLPIEESNYPNPDERAGLALLRAETHSTEIGDYYADEAVMAGSDESFKLSFHFVIYYN